MSANSQTFETYRPLLFSIAYRMLGSAMEAEDMVQEAYLRYVGAGDEGIQSPKAYLSTIVTRLCIDHLKSAKTQRENYVGTWLPEPLLTGPSPGAVLGERETITVAFMVLLESLSPIERAIFLLHDVFDYTYAEIAPVVGKSEANCRQYYHRAKAYITERRPRFDPSPEEQARLIERFLLAVATGDVDGLTQMLAEDVVTYGDGGGKAPAARQPLVGREKVIRLLLGIYRQTPPGLTVEIIEFNGLPAVGVWQGNTAVLVMNLTILDHQIKTIHNILNPDKLRHLRRSDEL